MDTRRTFLARTGSFLGGMTGLLATGAMRPTMASKFHTFNRSLELSFVLFELKLFAEQYLPLLLAPRVLCHEERGPRLVSRSHHEEPPGSCHCHCTFRLRLANWRQAVVRLQQKMVRACLPPFEDLVLEEFEEIYANSYPVYPGLLDRPEGALYSLNDWKICWHIYPFFAGGPKDRLHEGRRALEWSGNGGGDSADAWEDLQRRLPEIKNWYLRLPPLGNEHLKACQRLLPILADADPTFPLTALDRRRMKALVLGDNDSSPAEQTSGVRILDSEFYSSCFCGVLAFVIQALANNHFCAIGGLLGLPEVYGDVFWNGLMPKIIFAVLLRKVEVLCQLAQGNREGQ